MISCLIYFAQVIGFQIPVRIIIIAIIPITGMIRIAVTVRTTATVSRGSRAAVLRLPTGFLLYLAANDPGTDPVYLIAIRCCRISQGIAVFIKIEALCHSIIVRIDPGPSSFRIGTVIKLVPHSVRVGFPCSRKCGKWHCHAEYRGSNRNLHSKLSHLLFSSPVMPFFLSFSHHFKIYFFSNYPVPL